jgi:hypothetical protein
MKSSNIFSQKSAMMQNAKNPTHVIIIAQLIRQNKQSAAQTYIFIKETKSLFEFSDLFRSKLISHCNKK